VDRLVKATIAQVPEFLARNRKLISPNALVRRIATPGSWKIVEVAKEFLLGMLWNCRIHLPIWFAQFLGKHEPGGL
jgi:hypothetical protein